MNNTILGCKLYIGKEGVPFDISKVAPLVPFMPRSESQMSYHEMSRKQLARYLKGVQMSMDYNSIDDAQVWSIGEFAKLVGLKGIKTLQRWDNEGLLVAGRHPATPAAREQAIRTGKDPDKAGRRFYTKEHYRKVMRGYYGIKE